MSNPPTIEDVIAALVSQFGEPNVRHTRNGRPWCRWDSERHMIYVSPFRCHGRENVHVELVVFADDGDLRRSFAVAEFGACDHYPGRVGTLDDAMAADGGQFHVAPLAVVLGCAARVMAAR